MPGRSSGRQAILRCPGTKLLGTRVRVIRCQRGTYHRRFDLVEVPGTKGRRRIYLVLETTHGNTCVNGTYICKREGMHHLESRGTCPDLPLALDEVLRKAGAL